MDRKWSKCADTGSESVEHMEGITERVTETRSQLAKAWRAAGQGIFVGCVSMCWGKFFFSAYISKYEAFSV